MSARLDAFVVAVPGLEPLVLAEVQKLGVRPAHAVRGGVECTVTWPQLWALNVRCRVATRVLVRLRRFKADGFHSLEKGLGAIPWGEWLDADAGVQVSVTADAGSKLYHSGAVEERVIAALGRPEGAQRVFVRVLNDVVTVSLDASGDSLHRRGYRGAAGKAPLRETLAAAVVLASGWDARSALIDPFCGSGTIAIEAAMIARRMAPGRHRSFAFQAWPSFSAAAWERLLRGADGDVVAKCPPIIASDRDAGAVAAAVANAAAAGVGGDSRGGAAFGERSGAAGRPAWLDRVEPAVRSADRRRRRWRRRSAQPVRPLRCGAARVVEKKNGGRCWRAAGGWAACWQGWPWSVPGRRRSRCSGCP